jgi:hypothetical protein
MTRNPHKTPNPQGKGLVPVLADWQATRPVLHERKDPQRLLRDWFASALVLSADFRFRPVVGQAYFLYHRDGRWRLSLIAPEEWRNDRGGRCLGRCELRPDMTWSIEPLSGFEADEVLLGELSALVASFAEDLERSDRLDDVVPGYRRELPYHQRMLATALGSSLRLSVDREARLAAPARALLRAAGGFSAPILLASPPDTGKQDAAS